MIQQIPESREVREHGRREFHRRELRAEAADTAVWIAALAIVLTCAWIAY